MVDKTSIVPLYYQIKDLILSDIRSGKYKVGDRIPGELDFAMEYDVSRPTVRQAINELVYDKLLWRERGKGTFVNQPMINSNLDILTPYVEELRSQGLSPGLEILSNTLVPASSSVARALHLVKEDKVIQFVRLRLANAVPVILRTSYFSYAKFPFLLTESKETLEPLYPLIESQGYSINKAEQNLQVVKARKEEAALLHVAEGFPLILWEGVVYTDDGHPMELVKSLYRSDRYNFQIVQYRRK